MKKKKILLITAILLIMASLFGIFVLGVYKISDNIFIFNEYVKKLLSERPLRKLNINNNKHILFIGVDGLSGPAVLQSKNNNYKDLEKHSIYNVNGERSRWTYTIRSFMSISSGKDLNEIELSLIKNRLIDTSIFNTISRSKKTTAIFESGYNVDGDVFAAPDTYIDYYPFNENISKSVMMNEFEKLDEKTTIKGMDYFLKNQPTFEMMYIANPDHAGHNFNGWSKEYLRSIEFIGERLKYIIDRLKTNPTLAKNTLVYITSDHGFEKNMNSHTNVNTFNTKHVPVYFWNIDYNSKKANEYESKNYNARFYWEEWLEGK
ncbi:MAG: hypothetical protein GY679_03565 [Mycoplasma sp.]|nr:hypothetical protein [Mycoplasma sp.]